MDRRVTRRARALAAGGLALALTWPALVAGAEPYRRGEFVTVRGRVNGAGGSPLAGATVLLEASRRSFELSRPFRKKENRPKTDGLTVPATADAGGNYSFEWRWDPYYDTFELAVALPVKKDGRDGFEVFHRVDFTERMRQGSPVEVALVVADGDSLGWLERFLSGRASADEKRIFGEMGRPDQIDTRDRPEGSETSWWYFADGKVFRFLGGALRQVTHFEPVPEIP